MVMNFDDDHGAANHAVVHRDVHAACVRVVPNEEVSQATDELQILFPHDVVLTTSMGCCHACVYTHTASAAVVAERIAEHLREVEHRPER
jgi:hypothetical protein